MKTKSTSVIPLYVILWGFIFFAYQSVVYPCPAFLPSKGILSKMDSSKRWSRKSFRAYRWDGDLKNNKKQNSFLDVQEVPLQLDFLDPDGHLLFKENAEAWENGTIDFTERFAWNRGAFSIWPDGFDPNMALGEFRCKESFWTWVYNPKQKTKKILLHYCDPASTIGSPSPSSEQTKSEIRIAKRGDGDRRSPIFFDEASRKVVAPFYEYHYEVFNHLMFSYIDLLIGEKERVRVSEKSEQNIHIDVKNFFNLNFDAKDIESKVTRHRYEPYSMVAQLETFLKILFFKIDLELLLNVSFYEDSVHIPMILTMPSDGPSNVNPGSGLMFTWENSNPNFEIDFKDGMPLLSSEQIFKGYKTLGSYAESFCNKSSIVATCHFYFLARYANYRFKVGFDIPREKVEQGFFPMFIADADVAKKELKWNAKTSASNKNPKKRIGFYMETGVLKKGEHYWDLWLQMQKKENVGDVELESCPINLVAE